MLTINNKFYKYYTSQVDESDCGVACLSMILKKYDSYIPIAKLRELAHTTRKGTSALAIIKTANKFGLKANAVKANLAILDDPDIKYPWIAHVIKKEKLLHYYVVYGADERYVYIADPDSHIQCKKMLRKDFKKEWTNIALLFTPSSNYHPQHIRMKGMGDNFRILEHLKGMILNIIFLSALISIISIASSLYLQVLIDRLIPHDNVHVLGILTLGLMVTYVAYSCFSYIRRTLLMNLNIQVAKKLNISYMKLVLKLPLQFFLTRKTGEILSRFNDITKIIDALSSTVVTIFLDIGILIIIGIAMAYQNIWLFLITILTIPLYIISMLSFKKLYTSLNNSQMESNAKLNSLLIESIRGIETIKALNLEKKRINQIKSQFTNFLKLNLKYEKVDSVQQGIKLFLQYGLTTIILYLGSLEVIHSELPLGKLMAFDMLLSFFIDPLQTIINLQPKLQSAQVANRRLNEVMIVRPEEIDSKDIKSKKLSIATIEFKDVSYSYNFGKPILNKVSIKISSKDKIAIMGKSGSGKSTLAKLIVQLLKPSDGLILINNQPIQEYSLKQIRKSISYVPQQSMLFSGSIKDNLRLAAPKATNSDIYNACKFAMIDKDIQKLPLKYDSLVDESSKILSGGQIQRLAIARAVLSPANVLIFDESTSSLDPTTEEKVIGNILKLDKTVIFISHRQAVIDKMNRILTIENGKVIEKH